MAENSNINTRQGEVEEGSTDEEVIWKRVFLNLPLMSNVWFCRSGVNGETVLPAGV